MRLAGGIGLCLCTFLWIVPRAALANEFAKFLDEYVCNPIRQYQPDDPWTRSRFYRVQTGYAGLFRDCDNEEQKRCSPYICWKYSQCPTVKERFLDFISPDLDQVKQRVRDGAGACCASGNPGACNCSKCARVRFTDGDRQFHQTSNRGLHVAQNCSCPNCRGAAQQTHQFADQTLDQFSDQFVAPHSFAVDSRFDSRNQVSEQRVAEISEAVVVDKSASKFPNNHLIPNKNQSKAPIAVTHEAESNDFVSPWRANSGSRR